MKEKTVFMKKINKGLNKKFNDWIDKVQPLCSDNQILIYRDLWDLAYTAGQGSIDRNKIFADELSKRWPSERDFEYVYNNGFSKGELTYWLKLKLLEGK